MDVDVDVDVDADVDVDRVDRGGPVDPVDADVGVDADVDVDEEAPARGRAPTWRWEAGGAQRTRGA